MKDLWIEYEESLKEGEESTEEGFTDWFSGMVDSTYDQMRDEE
jgi:hypothetical protein